MKKSGKFKYFLMIMFFVFIKMHDFCTGIYDGVTSRYGSAVQVGRPLLLPDVRNEIAYLAIEIALTMLFYLLIIKRIAAPVETLTEGMRNITGGKLDTRLSITANYEFQTMVDSFNLMARELEEAKVKNDLYEQEKNQLFASIAHDLKTPMTMILGYARALSDGAVRDEQKKADYLKVIYEQTKHTNQLLDVLFEYAKLQNAQYELKLEKGDIGECLRQCLAGYIDLFEQHGILLDIQIPEEPVEWEFDSVEMSRVFYNLFSNAVKHNPGGAALYVGLSSGGGIEITVADNGAPLDEEVKSKLFRPFTVGDRSRSTKGGSGLGLAVAKKIVEKHGGTLELSENYPGYRKTFVITLM